MSNPYQSPEDTLPKSARAVPRWLDAGMIMLLAPVAAWLGWFAGQVTAQLLVQASQAGDAPPLSPWLIRLLIGGPPLVAFLAMIAWAASAAGRERRQRAMPSGKPRD